MSESREQFVDHPFEIPIGKTELIIAQIIADVLGVDRVGRTDSFYDFGGTSLQAIRICARVESELGHEAMPAWLFTNDVLTDFAGKVQAERVLTNGSDD